MMQRIVFDFISLLIVSGLIFPIATHAAGDASVQIGAGSWPADLKLIQGDGWDGRQLVFTTPKVPVAPSTFSDSAIKIDQRTIVYVPQGAKIIAKPKAYTHPELSDEVQKFYVQGVGNYAFWAFIIGLAAAFQ